MESLTVLFVSPHPQDANTLAEMLDSELLIHVGTVQEAGRALVPMRFHVVITEADLEDGTWQDILEIARELPYHTAVVVAHPDTDARFWTKATHSGASDIVTQPFVKSEVVRVVNKASSQPIVPLAKSSMSIPRDESGPVHVHATRGIAWRDSRTTGLSLARRSQLRRTVKHAT